MHLLCESEVPDSESNLIYRSPRPENRDGSVRSRQSAGPEMRDELEKDSAPFILLPFGVVAEFLVGRFLKQSDACYL